MKLLISIIATALLSLVFCVYLPWWSISIAALVVSVVIHQSPGRSFFSGFLALFFLWTILSWYISFKNENILAHRISLVIFKVDSPILLIFLTGFVGAIVAGFAATAGSYLRGKS
ncbi:MAG: hypothetical protein C5B52_08370 [Bacteroidetes bacterium]|nr:MAG: hypothetical protein C5B52_08370 [Bacteroidota bacterium]